MAVVKTYPWSPAQADRLANCPQIDDRRGMPRWAREHMGQQVAVRYVTVRGDRRHRTQIGFAYGTLVESEKADCYTIESRGATLSIHYRKITTMYLTEGQPRTASKPRRPAVKCPYCEQPAGDDDRPTTVIDVVDRGYGRTSSGFTYFKDVPGKRTWHTDCLEQFQAQNAAYRRRCLVEELRDAYEAAVEAGYMTREAFIEHASGPDSKYPADVIEEALR